MPSAPLVEPGPDLTAEQLTRYARQLLLPTVGAEGQRRLLAARVAVVGAGGLGSPALLYLAGAGVGHLTVIDADQVDATNLHRQVIHDHRSIGGAKTASAGARIRALNPDCAVREVRERLDPSNAAELLGGHDLILDGSDNFDTRYAVDEAAHALGLPVVWAAVHRTAAHLTTFWTAAPDGLPAVGLRDLFPTPPDPASTPTCAEVGVIGALVGQVGSMMAAEAIRLITGRGRSLMGRVLYIDSEASTQREIPLVSSGRYPTVAPAEATLADAEATANGGAPALSTNPDTLTSDDLLSLLGAGSSPLVLDVREEAEHRSGVIPGSLLVPLGDLLTKGSPPLVAGREVVVVCAHGPRATLAAGALIAGGHASVRVLIGGMAAWTAQGHPVEDATEAPTTPTTFSTGQVPHV